jgi:hypothetical protein
LCAGIAFGSSRASLVPGDLALPAFALLASLGIDHPQAASFWAVAASDYATSTGDGSQRNSSEHECETQAQDGAKATVADGAASGGQGGDLLLLLLNMGL